MKKLVSLLLAAVLCCTAAVTLAGCGDKNYPVSIANITIEKEPANIVVLDPSSADIISYMNYDGKLVGRSTEVDQSFLAVAPEVGTANTPDVNAIIDAKAEIVFATDKIDEKSLKELEDAKIKVIKMSIADSPKELERNYNTIGIILGGEITGAEKGKSAYDKLIEHMDKLKVDAATAEDTQGVLTACYLYVDNGTLCVMNNGTYVDMLMGYTGAVNVAVNAQERNVDVSTLKIANPNFIFYDSEQTLDVIRNDKVLSQLDAVKGDHIMMVTQKQVSRQGLTALDTLEKMIYFMHPQLALRKATADEAAQAAVKETQAQAAAAATEPAAQETQAPQAATEAATNAAAAAEPKSEAEKYDIKLDDLSLKKEDENANVKAMQQRLFDLGYITESDNVTGYYGDVSAKAVEAFQKNSKLEETGAADNKTLTALFMDNAPKAE